METSPAAPWSVLFIDIDGFRAVNDLHGHAVGDTMLTRADRLRARLRPQDAAARLGGDEFALLCPDTDTLLRDADTAMYATKRRTPPPTLTCLSDTDALGGPARMVAPSRGSRVAPC